MYVLFIFTLTFSPGAPLHSSLRLVEVRVVLGRRRRRMYVHVHTTDITCMYMYIRQILHVCTCTYEIYYMYVHVHMTDITDISSITR